MTRIEDLRGLKASALTRMNHHIRRAHEIELQIEEIDKGIDDLELEKKEEEDEG